MNEEDFDELAKAIARAIEIENYRRQRLNKVIPWIAGGAGFISGIATTLIIHLFLPF